MRVAVKGKIIVKRNEKHELKEAYKIVVDDLMTKGGLFSGYYDAKNSSKEFMSGIMTVIESMAVQVSDGYADKFVNNFIENLIESENKAEEMSANQCREHVNMKVIDDIDFIRKMAEVHNVDISVKVSEGKIYKLYLDVKYSNNVSPSGGASAVMSGFIDWLVRERMAA